MDLQIRRKRICKQKARAIREISHDWIRSSYLYCFSFTSGIGNYRNLEEK